MAHRFLNSGSPSTHADLLAGMDSAIAQGDQNRVTDTVERIAGRPPTSPSRFASEQRARWLDA